MYSGTESAGNAIVRASAEPTFAVVDWITF